MANLPRAVGEINQTFGMSGIYLNTYCDYNTRVNGKKERSTRILQSDHCGNSSIVKSIGLERVGDLYKVGKRCPLLSDALKKVNAQQI